MWLLVGLGNPGAEYQLTRHNIGFQIIDQIAKDYNFGEWKEYKTYLATKATIAGQQVLLVKPQTFMNLSGKVIPALMQFYKLAPQNIAVIHDDLDIAPAKVRVKLGGGNGGHNGLKSIDAAIGNNYIRIRVGIGRPTGLIPVSSYVLGKLSSEELLALENCTKRISAEIPLIFEGKLDLFSSRVNI